MLKKLEKIKVNEAVDILGLAAAVGGARVVGKSIVITAVYHGANKIILRSPIRFATFDGDEAVVNANMAMNNTSIVLTGSLNTATGSLRVNTPKDSVITAFDVEFDMAKR